MKRLIKSSVIKLSVNELVQLRLSLPSTAKQKPRKPKSQILHFTPFSPLNKQIKENSRNLNHYSHMQARNTHIFVGFLIWAPAFLNIRDIGSRNATWVNQNTRKEREKAKKKQERENQSVQRPSWALQPDPILQKNENCDVIDRHRDGEKSFALHWGFGAWKTSWELVEIQNQQKESPWFLWSQQGVGPLHGALYWFSF
jgi:hypothetical protein